MQRKNNDVIRRTLNENKVFQWQLAEHLGIAEYTLTRMLRHELPPERQNEICRAIIEIAEGRDKL